LPVPDQAASIRVLGRDSRGGRVALRHAQSREVRPAGAPVPPFAYRLRVDPRTPVVDATPPEAQHLALPEQHPAVVALAARLGEEAGRDPVVLAERLESWLSSNFSYSSELPRDPSLDYFLLERQAGHCEYFATAMVVLLRLQGVPARVAVGFQGGRWNPSGGYYTVRQGDAHAWVEVYREGVGWLRYEPTPAAGIGRGGAPVSLGERLSDLWDSVQSAWARHVLAFNRAAQMDLVRRVREAVDDLGRAFDRSRPSGSRLVKSVAWALGGALLVGLCLLALSRRRSSKAGRAGLGEDERRARLVYRTFLRALARVGIERRPHETSRDVLERVRSLPGASSEALRRASSIVDRYDASRFGGRPMPKDEAGMLLREARRVSEELSRSCR
ncbi:MAG: DUF4129 domain-containing transglutaminase family protein, partial [Myxococcota bacterium]